MAGFSSEEILDLLYKKVAFGVNKSGTSEQFTPAQETSASFIAVPPAAFWREATATNVPTTPPSTTSSYVQVYASHSGTQPSSTSAVVQCTANADAQPMPNQENFKRSWDTGLQNWIGPTFGAGYLVKVYVGPANWDGDTTDNTITQVIFGSDSNRDWYFDYEGGMLYWTPEGESGTGVFEDSDSWTTFTDTHVVYIAGYRYIGAVGAGSGDVSLTDFSVSPQSASGGGSLTYDNAGQFTYTPPALSDFIELTSISVGGNAAASGSGGLAYASATGVFTYTPPDLSSYISLTSISVGTDAAASGSGGLAYANGTGVFTYTPPDLSSYISLTSISVGTDAAASGSGGLAYANGTGVFTYTPPDLSGYLTAETFTSVTVNAAASTTTYNVALLSQSDTATTTDVYIESTDLTFTHSTTADRGKLTTGDLLVQGNLTVLGDGELINLQQENIYMKDAILTLGITDADVSDLSDAAAAGSDVGIEAYKAGANSATPQLLYDYTNKYWTINNENTANAPTSKIAQKYVLANYEWQAADVTATKKQITHNLNTQRIVVQVTDSADEIVYCKYDALSVNTIEVYIPTAVAGEFYDVVIIG